MTRFDGLVLVAVAAVVAFAVRTVVVLATRRRRPTVAAAVDRWWPWVPAVVVAAVLIRASPILGTVLTVALVLLLRRADAVGSPFRPRR